MTRWAVLTTISAAVAVALAVATRAGTPPSAPDQAKSGQADRDADLVASLLDAHNRERAREKLPPLKLDPKLTAAAQAHTDDMAKHQKMTHEGSDKSTPAERVKRFGYVYRTTGENVARGWPAVEKVMRGWMDSPEHRENILGKYTEIGIGVARDDKDVPYWCVDFGTPIPKLEPTRAAADVVDAVNKKRVAARRPPLRVHPKLAQAAARIAQGLAQDETVEGAKDRGKDVVQALKKAGYRYRKLAEVAAAGQSGVDEVVNTWMESPQHRVNVLGDFTDVGAGYASSPSGTPYWCLILAQPLGE